MSTHDHGLDILGMQIFVKGPPQHHIGARTKQTARHTVRGLVEVLGDTIDTAGLKERLDELPKTNRSVWDMWGLHGNQLIVRITQDAQDILNRAIIPTSEFAYHDMIIAFANSGKALDAKIAKLPYDDSPCPFYDDVASFFMNGATLANTLEDLKANAVKWSDVKETVKSAAQGVASAAGGVQSTIKYTYWITIGAAVLAVGALSLGAYKFLSGPYAPKLAQRYLP